MKLGNLRSSTLFLFAAGFALFAGVTWIRTATVKATYLYVRQEKELKRLQEDLQSLRVDWSRATSPGKLQGLAKVLGLGPAMWNQVIRLKPTREPLISTAPGVR